MARSPCTSLPPRERKSTPGNIAMRSPRVRTEELEKCSAVSTAAGSGEPKRVSAWTMMSTTGRVCSSRVSSACAQDCTGSRARQNAVATADLCSWRSAM